MVRRSTIHILCTVLFLVSAAVRSAHSEEPDDGVDEPRFQRCINIRAIRTTDVLSDNAIVFRLIGGDYFVNQLPQSCRGLSRDRRFSYEVYERRLCSNDRIRVLMHSGGSMVEGRSCKLGEFRRLTDSEIEQVYSPDSRVPNPEPVESAEVEDIDEDGDEQER